ncbi:MAG TPA: class I SAM-dependent RNA methyltransferase [Terriglobales bacterium]|nr:class I SAM-dependent RNA methyltransferase [Terriglobales bacterium]
MELLIEKLVYGGEGLARLASDEQGRRKAAFVPFVIEGERVEGRPREEQKSFTRIELERVLQPSPQRIEPGCPYFQRCGGCHYQHIDYKHQLEVKADILKENLRRLAKVELPVELQIHAAEPWNYRNRARLQVQSEPEFAIGYFKFNSHEWLPVEKCPISSPLINRAIGAMWEIGRAGGASGIREIEFFADAQDAQLLVEVYGEGVTDKFGQEWKSLLPESVGIVVFPAGAKARLDVPLSSTAGAMGVQKAAGASKPRRPGRNQRDRDSRAETGAHSRPSPLLGDGGLVYKTRLASYRVSAGAFFQVNRYLTDELVSVVTAGRSGKTALDLYAGGGLFSSVLSREFERVLAVESSPISYSDLQYNSSRNVKAVRAMSAEYLHKAAGKLKPDLVVMDPPRGGLGESVVHRLVTLGAPRLTYVSCDPATLSRDLAGLLKAGYRIEQAHLVDLFPQTYHLESVFHLIR